MNKKRFLIINLLLWLCTVTFCQATTVNVVLSGNLPANIRSNINNVLTQIKQQSSNQNYASIENFSTLAKKKIIGATSPFGYFTPTVNILQKRNIIRIHIKLNQPIKLTRVNVGVTGEGVFNAKFTRYLQHQPLKAGMKLSTPLYEKVKTSLYRIAASQGYFKAKMKASKILVNLIKKTATINLILETGKRQTFGETRISKTELSDHFIKKFLQYKPGSYYNHKDVINTQNALTNSGYFQQAIITPEPSNIKQNSVPMHIYLVPVKKKSYTLGLGYGTDTGIRGLANLTNNYWNSKGHKIKIIAQVAKNNQNISSIYTIPSDKPYQHYYTITGALAKFSINKNNSRAMKLTLGNTQIFHQWQSIISLNALQERYALTNITTVASLLYPQLHIKYKSVDKAMKTSNGISININATATPKALSSTSPFAQTSLGARILRTIQATQTRLLARAELITTNIDDLTHLPLSLQLFAGGTQSIRGYTYDSIGPGKNLFTASVEVQQKIYKDFYFASFFDTGNVDNSFSKLFNQPYSAYGFGLAWLSPIGILEISAADPLKKPHSRWVLQFSMGAYL